MLCLDDGMERFSSNVKFPDSVTQTCTERFWIFSSLGKVTLVSIKFIVSSWFILSEEQGFTVCQTFLLSAILLIFIFAK